MSNNLTLKNSIKLNSVNIHTTPIDSQKVISFFTIEEETHKIFVALDLENYLYIWLIKNEIIDAISLLDEIDHEDKKNLFPDLCFNLNEFILNYYNFSSDKKIIISNFNYISNSFKQYIQITGNFNSIILSSLDFSEYIKLEIEKNFANLNRYENILNDTLNFSLSNDQKIIGGIRS